MPSGKKRKRHKMATHKRKKRLRKNRHKTRK
ncbi:MAG: AURKAIP1/COX24 domain-containing protein [Prolixibacteraceae bacterium]|nr:AURKAIP1/COX24 domain-containing protein [Prolixibacteraceae bacterium]